MRKIGFFSGNGDPICWRKQKEWKIWNNIESAFRHAGFNEIMDNDYISDDILKKTIVTNALFFTYANDSEKGLAKRLNTLLGPDIVNECMKLTGELIFEIIKPRMVICSSCSMVFEPLIKNYNADIRYEVFSLEGTRKRVMKCVYSDVTVLGIPHTSYPVPLSVAAFVRDSYLGKDIGYTMSNVKIPHSRIVSYKPSINIIHIIELITSCKDFRLCKIENTSERYGLSANLILTITKTGKGYLAIRHKNFDGHHYPNSRYELTTNYRNILNDKGWNCDSPVWIGTKYIRDFGIDEDEIVTNIVSEINEIVELVRKN